MTPGRLAPLPLHRDGAWPSRTVAGLRHSLSTLPLVRPGRFPIDYVVLINIAAMPVGESPVAAFDDVRIMRRGTILSICVQYCLRSGGERMEVPVNADAGEDP